MNERYVLGEGFGLGKGILNDGPNKGAFAWIGLTADRDGVVACPLRFPNTRAVVGCKCAEPRKRRKFRLVLEVIEEAPEPMTDEPLVLTDAQLHVLKHSLGLDWKDVPYRNWFKATAGHHERGVCEVLVSLGLMEMGDDSVFIVTTAGMKAVCK